MKVQPYFSRYLESQNSVAKPVAAPSPTSVRPIHRCHPDHPGHPGGGFVVTRKFPSDSDSQAPGCGRPPAPITTMAFPSDSDSHDPIKNRPPIVINPWKPVRPPICWFPIHWLPGPIKDAWQAITNFMKQHPVGSAPIWTERLPHQDLSGRGARMLGTQASTGAPVDEARVD